MYYIVTGAAGFIGSNLVKALNERGITDILAVDDLKDGTKFANLTDCEIADYLDTDEFLEKLEEGDFDGQMSAILHQGACSTTALLRRCISSMPLRPPSTAAIASSARRGSTSRR